MAGDTLDLFGLRLDATKTSIIGLIIKGTVPILPAFSLCSFSLFLGYIPKNMEPKNWWLCRCFSFSQESFFSFRGCSPLMKLISIEVGGPSS